MGNMKANRKFKNEEEAVSAVIGVILMVAITVAIAATVYVYVSGMLTPGSQKQPELAFIADDVNNKITVTKVSEDGLLWGTDIVVYCTDAWPTGVTSLNTTTVEAGGIISGLTDWDNVSISYKGQQLYGTWEFEP